MFQTVASLLSDQQITDALLFCFCFCFFFCCCFFFLFCFFPAEHCIPNKGVTIRPSEALWINCQIQKFIRKRKRFFKIFKERMIHCTKLFRNRVVTEIRNSKKNYFDKLDRLLSTNTTNSKFFGETP